MARLITKFKYLKADARTRVGGNARCIATREGVEKIDQTYHLLPRGELRPLGGRWYLSWCQEKGNYPYEGYYSRKEDIWQA